MNISFPTTLDGCQALIRQMAWNEAFGCFTRFGFEKWVWPQIREQARWIVFFDLDNIHKLNEAHGSYEPVDEMIKLGLSVLRWTDFVAGQVKSGDEFMVCMLDPRSRLGNADEAAGVDDAGPTTGDQRETLDPHALVGRLKDSLKRAGLSASFAIVPVDPSSDLMTNLKPAIDQVFAQKQSRGRA